MSGIASSVEQLLGRSRIPASAVPVTAPSIAQPRKRKLDTRRNRKRPSKSTGKRDGRRLVMNAIDREWRTPAEIARIAGVSVFVVYSHLPGLLDAGFLEMLRGIGARAAKRYRRAG